MIKPKLFSDRNSVLKVPVPPKTESYTPISCQLIFETIDNLSKEFNINLTQEEFLLSSGGRQQRLRFFFGSGEFVKELVVLNSYDKSIALRAASGTNVFICSNGVMVGDIKIYKRHVSNVDDQIEDFLRECFQEMEENIDYIRHIKVSYSNFLLDRESISNILGQLFFKLNLLSTTQLNTIKREYEKPSYDYGTDPLSMWTLYQHVTFSMRYETALNYLETRRSIQKYFADYVFDNSEELKEAEYFGESFFNDYEV